MYRARLVIVLSLTIFALGFFFALTLLPSYLAISLAGGPDQTTQENTHTSSDETISIARAQMLVTKLLPVLSATSSPTAVIATAIKDRPAGVVLSHISYTAGEGDATGELLLVGDAPREKVSAYRDALTADPLFKTVSVPVGALVGTDGGHFSITLGGTF